MQTINLVPDVSVIVPVYNCERFIKSQLDALLGYDVNVSITIEVIAIDDGSQDTSLALLRAYQAQHPNLKVFEQKNAGPSSARNVGLAHATGEWVAFADADDILFGHSLQEWVQQARVQQLDVLIGNGYRFVDEPNTATAKPILRKQPKDRILSGEEWMTYCVGVNEWPHYVWCQLINRSVITQHHLLFDTSIIHEDILWTLALSLLVQRIGFNSAPYYGYRRNADSIVNSPSPERLLHRATSYLKIIATLQSQAARSDLKADTRLALKRHAFFEVNYLITLLRKHIADRTIRQQLATALLKLHIWPSAFTSATDLKSCIRIAKAYLRTKKLQLF